MFQTPILFLIFNRPDLTRRVFEKIKEIQPKYLYVAADGPRKDKIGEYELCEETRATIKIDWDCELKTLYRTENLGCGLSVSEAITWFFEQVEYGIILEDDCLPNNSFFEFCSMLLEYYRNNETIMHIGGTNSQFGIKRNNYSYYFSKYPHIWGWATWQRAWKNYKYFFQTDRKNIEKIFKYYDFSLKEKKYWFEHLDMLNSNNNIDTWDIQWTFSCWLNKGITIVPNFNLISNLGFNENATHTLSVESKLANIPTNEIQSITHPNSIIINKQADKYTFTNYNLLEPPIFIRFKNWIANKTPIVIKYKLKNLMK